MEQISREADIPIYMTDSDDLPGEPGGIEHSCINMRVQNIKILADALGGDDSHADHIETRNFPTPNRAILRKMGLDDRIPRGAKSLSVLSGR